MLSIEFRKNIWLGAPKSLQQPNPSSLKDNDDGEDNYTVTRCHKVTAATNDGRIVRKGAMDSPHHQFKTGIARQQPCNGHTLYHGPAPLSLNVSASAENGHARNIPNDNRTKTTAKIKKRRKR